MSCNTGRAQALASVAATSHTPVEMLEAVYRAGARATIRDSFFARATDGIEGFVSSSVLSAIFRRSLTLPHDARRDAPFSEAMLTHATQVGIELDDHSSLRAGYAAVQRRLETAQRDAAQLDYAGRNAQAIIARLAGHERPPLSPLGFTPSDVTVVADAIRQDNELALLKQWEMLDSGSRQSLMQQVVDVIATAQGRIPCIVHRVESLEGAAHAEYIEPLTINLAESFLAEADVSDALTSIIHEDRHGQQWKSLQDAEKTPLIELWRENWTHYLKSQRYGQEIYEAQPLEADAFCFADRVVEEVYADAARD